MLNKEIVDKEIIRLTVNFWKASERFVQPFIWPRTLVFTFSIHLFFLSIHLLFLLYIIVQSWLWVIISYLSFVSCFVHSIMYYFSYLLTILLLVLVKITDIYLYEKTLIICKQITWGKISESLKNTSWEKLDWSFNLLNSIFIQNSIL